MRGKLKYFPASEIEVLKVTDWKFGVPKFLELLRLH
jgi:hypothetical protein